MRKFGLYKANIMAIATIREKLHHYYIIITSLLHHYIDVADDKKVKAIFTVMENDITETLNLWEDEDFVNEMNNRLEELESGKVKGVTLEEFKSRF